MQSFRTAIHRHVQIGAALAALIAGPAAAASPTVHIVLKFAKAGGPDGPVAALDPASCPACIARHDPAFERDNARETLVELDVPRGRFLELAFKVRPHGVRRVLLETSDLAFQIQGDRLTVALPPLGEDAIEAGEFSTNFVETGVVLRMEHADPERLAGAYAGKPPPAVERAAASNLEFAAREAARELGLGAYVASEKLGVIEIMGFDTNEPHGHLDAPPHMHMHLRWPYNTGTQIGHFYISPQGLLIQNKVWITQYGLPPGVYPPGRVFTTLDNHGRPVYAQTITAQGWWRIDSVRPGAPPRSCLVRPDGQGFQEGAVVACDGRGPIPVHVADDPVAGVATVRTGDILETLRYDPDTGRLRSPAVAPPVPESAVTPTARTELALPGAERSEYVAR